MLLVPQSPACFIGLLYHIGNKMCDTLCNPGRCYDVIALLVSKSHERTGNLRCQCVVSNFEYDGHTPRHIYRTPGEVGTWQVVRGEDDS